MALRRVSVYYGWYVVAVTALAMVGILPNRTQRFGGITEPLLADLRIDRGGLVTVLFFSVWSEDFGRRLLGRIQGAAQALTVLASAVGPLLLAWCVDLTGSYAAMFRVLSAIVAATAVAALVVEAPQPRMVPLPAPHGAA